MLPLALTAVLLLAELLNEAQIAEGVQEFKRCYNTSQEETHCFEVQYDNDQPLHTSFQNAQLRCKGLNSSLVTINRKEIDQLIQRFMTENNPIGGQYIWLNAYQINTYSTDSNRWHWLNTTVSDIPGSAVTWTWNPSCYTAVLEFRDDNGILQFYLTAKQPQSSFYYVCEYSESNCSSTSFSDGRLLINGRCYRAAKESVTWYEARNRCLNGGGDLASFANVSNVNFTSLLGTMSFSRYWIGLRFIWYTWGDSGSDAMYTNWATNADIGNSPCLILCPNNCNPSYSWLSTDCNSGSTYVVCHAITTLQPTTTSTIEISTSTTSTALTSLGSKEPLSNSSLPPNQSSESISSKRLAIGIGVGVGVGVPLIIAVIVIVICIVLRKRRQLPSASSAQLNNNREEMESSSFDKPISDPTVKAKSEIEAPTYGTVVPSTLSRQLAEASGANSKSEPAEYAPLQFL